MLANLSDGSTHTGTLNSDVHRPASFRYELLDFIAEELPRWRDDPERPPATSETELTEHLCDYLSGVARKSPGWDILQFRTEAADEVVKGRKLDVAPKSCGVVIWIDGRRYTQYEPLLPIECKRLPTPKENNRDEREYVFSKYSSTGGIQRFKAGNHGAAHNLGGMIAYIEEGAALLWNQCIGEWIRGLVVSKQAGWSLKDLVELQSEVKASRVCVLRSQHTREEHLPDIELRHLWVEMN
jgi:hypothetical protein